MKTNLTGTSAVNDQGRELVVGDVQVASGRSSGHFAKSGSTPIATGFSGLAILWTRVHTAPMRSSGSRNDSTRWPWAITNARFGGGSRKRSGGPGNGHRTGFARSPGATTRDGTRRFRRCRSLSRSRARTERLASFMRRRRTRIGAGRSRCSRPAARMSRTSRCRGSRRCRRNAGSGSIRGGPARSGARSLAREGG